MKSSVLSFCLLLLIAPASAALSLDGDRASSHLAQAPIDRQATAEQLLEQGTQQFQTGDYEAAIATWDAAAGIYQDLGDRYGEATALVNMGSAYTALGDSQQAMDFIQRSLILRDELGMTPAARLQQRILEGIAFTTLGEMMQAQDQPDLAIAFFKHAMNTRESIREELRQLDGDFPQPQAESLVETCRRLADLLMQQDRALEAQPVLDWIKVEESDEYLEDVPEIPRQLQYQDFERELIVLYDRAISEGQELGELRQISPTLRSPEQQNRLAELVANQQTLVQRYYDFIDRPDVRSRIDQLSLSTSQESIQPAQLNALQDNLQNLNQNAALLYPLVLDDRIELLLVTPYAPPIRRTVMVDQAELAAAIAEFRNALANRTRDPRPEAEQFYEWLIEPIAADLQEAGTETLLYAPDGQLRYIPLAALYDDDQWLIERFRINYITSASLTDFDTLPQNQITVLAGAFTQGSYSFQVGTRQLSLGGLPFAGVEVDNIAAEIPNTTTLIDSDFSLTTTVAQMGDYTIVHLATHAEFVPGLPEESFILFGDGDRATLRDVATWSLQNVDLVVLSACQTAVGGELGNGEEILGFGYQLQRTGARAAIASLWSVDDGGTQALMNSFYTALQRGDTTKAEALRQAQIALISGDESVDAATQPGLYTHPYYWAPFILIGNGL